MITFTEDALALIAAARSPVCIDVPHTVSGCCFDITDCPAVRLGEPPQPNGYTRQTLQGATVHVPHGFPEDGEHVIRVRSSLSRKRLVLSGWRLL